MLATDLQNWNTVDMILQESRSGRREGCGDRKGERSPARSCGKRRMMEPQCTEHVELGIPAGQLTGTE